MPTPAANVSPPVMTMHYREVQSATQLAARNHVIISVRAEELWDSSAHAHKVRQVVVEASRGTTDATPAARRKFAFVWPDHDVKRLEEALRLIGWHVENRPFVSGRESEVYVEVYDWLRLGWLASETEWMAVADFHCDGLTIRAELEDLTALHELKNFIAPAVVPPKKSRRRKA